MINIAILGNNLEVVKIKVSFNDQLASKLADWLSTMAMFYGVAFLVMLPLIWQRPANLVGWAQYVISVFFQGVALPVLGFVSKKEGDRNNRLLKETHDAVMSELAIVKEALALASEERDEIKILLQRAGIKVP